MRPRKDAERDPSRTRGSLTLPEPRAEALLAAANEAEPALEVVK